MESFQKRIAELEAGYEALVTRPNVPDPAYNGIYTRYRYPILTAAHAPLFWRYDLDPRSNPYCMERIGVNSGAIKFNGRYLIMARVEGADRKSFFAVAESPNGIDNFRFWDYPVTMPEYGEPATNVYDMRLTAHEDGWIYGVFCVERKDPAARPGDLSSAVASAGIARTKDLVNWERLPDLKSRHQQRNAVLHPEFIDGKYAFYTRPQEGFIEAGNGGGIGWALIDDITHAEVREERIINCRYYHTIKEVKNGEGPSIEMWKKLAAQDPAFGHPEKFFKDIKETSWESWTVDTANKQILDAIQKICKRDPFSGKQEKSGWATFRTCSFRTDGLPIPTGACSSTTPRATPACTWRHRLSTGLWTTACIRRPTALQRLLPLSG